MRLLVTRPEPEASRTAQALAALGHEAILSPALRIVLDDSAAIPHLPFQAVLATSGNAVRALAANPGRGRLVALPLLAVGDRTALAAKRAGFGAARSADGDAEALAALALRTLDPAAGPLLYAAGEHRAAEIAAPLQAAGFFVATLVVYRSEPVTALSDAAAAAFAEGSVDGVLVYSRRSAAATALALRAARLVPLPEEVACYALSEAAAAPLRGLFRGPVRVAARPDQLSLFAAIEADGQEARRG